MAQLDWLEDRAPAAARRAVDMIHARLALLADFPKSAPEIDAHHRQAAVRFGRDGFVVRYRIEADAVVIVRLFHGRQDR
jgi:plasmid stabilization system protein ParE